VGGAAGAAGTPAAGSAGAPASGGAAGTSSGTGGTGGVNSDPLCKGIRSDMMCTNDGLVCMGLACGLADSGRRACNCSATWSCSSCDFTGSPFAEMPAGAPTCTTEQDDDPCTTVGAVCVGAPDGEVCACYTDDEGANIWDCDDPPWE
jgi:hypothetical protein